MLVETATHEALPGKFRTLFEPGCIGKLVLLFEALYIRHRKYPVIQYTGANDCFV